MPRPKKCRFVLNFPSCTIFMPNRADEQFNEPTVLSFEELEALRLADFEAMKQEEAALIMNISRATFGRIVEKARFIVTDALINGKAILIQGGEFCCLDFTTKFNNKQLNEYITTKQEKCMKCVKYQIMQNKCKEPENIKYIYGA